METSEVLVRLTGPRFDAEMISHPVLSKYNF